MKDMEKQPSIDVVLEELPLQRLVGEGVSQAVVEKYRKPHFSMTRRD